jgi:hypothetical protein
MKKCRQITVELFNVCLKLLQFQGIWNLTFSRDAAVYIFPNLIFKSFTYGKSFKVLSSILILHCTADIQIFNHVSTRHFLHSSFPQI